MRAWTWRKLIDVEADMKPASVDQVKPSSRNDCVLVSLSAVTSKEVADPAIANSLIEAPSGFAEPELGYRLESSLQGSPEIERSQVGASPRSREGGFRPC